MLNNLKACSITPANNKPKGTAYYLKAYLIALGNRILFISLRFKALSFTAAEFNAIRP